ncbi:MAG: sigma 54-interacting transcriptional regulator [Woeseiaceae bacterium]
MPKRNYGVSMIAVAASLIGMAASLIATQSWAADPRSVRFQSISREDGLSQAFVYAIVQDHEGFMWFGTQDGLNRFDGFDIKIFNHDPDDPSSLSDESIRTMIADRSGVLWMGTDAGGVSRYNSADQTFTNFVHDPENPDSISDNRIRVLYEDSAGQLWVGTDGSGLDLFHRDRGIFEHFRHDPELEDSLSGSHVWGILESSEGHLFIATDGGLSKFEPNSKTFTHYKHDPNDPTSLNDNQLRALYEDANRDLWVGTATGGLNRFNYETETFEHFVHDPNNASSISDNRVNAIFQDVSGVLWVGTTNGLNAWNTETSEFDRYFSNASDRYSLSHNNVSSIFQDRGGVLWVGSFIGVNHWSQHNKAMLHYRHDAENSQSLSDNTIMAFTEDQANDVWIATYGGGLNVLNRETDQMRQIRNVPGDSKSLSSDRVMSLFTDHEGVIWAGTRAAGLNRFESQTNTFTRFRHDPEDPASISSDGATFFLEDSNDVLWIATFGGGLNTFDRESGQFTRYRHDPDDETSLSNDRVVTLFEDSAGYIWIGTYGGGLNRYEPATGEFTTYRSDPARPDGLSGDEIYMIEEDTWGDLWIAVKGRGLNRWRRADREAGIETFQRFGTRDGLPSSTIYSGVWDQAGYLWLSTGLGLSRLDIGALEFKNYDTSHGLQDDEFNLSAGFGAANGQLFFGGVKGFNAFYPHLLDGSGPPPQVAITKFLSLNNPVNPGDMQVSDGRLQLQHDQNVIGFEFAALDFAAPRKNRFRYMLDGIDDGWVDAGTKRQVTYTNLPAGEYTFRVIASNNDRVWSDKEATFSIYMQPALWMTWWAKLVYLLAFAAIALLVLRAHARSVQQAGKLKHAEELGVIQARLTEAQRAASIGNWEWNAATKQLWWSDEVYRLFQMKPDPIGLNYELFLERVHPDDCAEVERAIMQTLEDHKPYELDYRIVRPDGTERVVHARAGIPYDENGEPTGIAGTIHDITERKKAENEIRHRADFQALLANLSSDLIQAQSDDIDHQVSDGLESVGSRYNLDAVSIWWFRADHENWRPLHRWARVEDGNQRNEVKEDQIPWIAEELRAGNFVTINNVENLPSAADQSILRKRAIKSLLIIPLLVDDKLMGACVYSMMRKERDWCTETVTELQLVAENLAGAIARSRAMSKIQHLTSKLQEENLYLREEVKLAHGFNEIIGEDTALKQCLLAAEKVAPTDVTALILGETGTGKELIARAIHKLSGRSDKPMVSVNCPALPATLIESELFGHEKGAFTGAQSQRRGRFEMAHTGTLFLDEIGELPLDLQGKLLRVLQTGEFQRIGGTTTIHSDVRLIAATNRDLKQAVALGEFRADLFYRINSFPITLPPLRDRADDIPLLSEHFVHKHAARLGKSIDAISARMLKELMSYAWPGNVRELESIIERALISAEDNAVLELTGPLLPAPLIGESKPVIVIDSSFDTSSFERAQIVSALEKSKWKISGENGAAAALSIPPSTLRSKMKRLNISR